MKKAKYLLLGTAGVAVLATSLSAGCNSNTFSTYAENKKMATSINSVYLQGYQIYDSSLSSGGMVDPFTDSTVPFLMNVDYEDKPVYANVNGVTKVQTPTFARYTLDLIDAIILVVNGEEITYDSDVAEITPAADSNGYYSKALVFKQSANQKSINHRSFLNNLNQASQMKFRVRQNVKWVDQNGNETKYSVRAKDFYLGYLRTVLSDYNYRMANGGTVEANKIASETTTNTSVNMDNNKAAYSNIYLLDLYDIDKNKLLSEQDSVETVGDREFYVISSTDVEGHKAAKFKELALKLLTGSADFIPVPSEYITENKENREVIQSQDPKTTKERLEVIRDTFLAASGQAKDAGFYWYGRTMDTTLFAGKYYGRPFDSNTLKLQVRLNKHYANQEYANDPRRIEIFERSYRTSAADAAQFQKAQWNQFLAGLTSTIPYTSLDSGNRKIVDNEPEKYGVTYVQVLNKTNATKHSINSPIPLYSMSAKYANNDPSFNVAFAKLNYGSSSANPIEDIKKGRFVTDLESSIVGYGSEFRSILSAAINVQYLATKANAPRESIPWNSIFAQDSDWNGRSLSEGFSYASPREAYKELNSYFVTNRQTGERYVLLPNKEKDKDLVAPGDTDATTAGADDALKSAAYAELQNKMTDLLDAFFAEHPEITDQKVVWSDTYRYLNYDGNYEGLLGSVVAAINGLDKKGRISYSIVKPENADAWYKFWLSAKHLNLMGWGYDYDSVGSGIDAISRSHMVWYFAAILNNEEFAAKAEKAYPQLVKAAKAFKAFVETEGKNYKIPVSFSDMTRLTNSIISDIDSAWKYLEVEENGTIHIYNEEADEVETKIEEVKAEIEKAANAFNDKEKAAKIAEKEQLEAKLAELKAKVKARDDENYQDLATITALFWINYTTQFENTKDLLDLLVEINNLLGISYDSDNYASKESFVKTVINPGYAVPSTAGQPFSSYADYKISNSTLETIEAAKNKK